MAAKKPEDDRSLKRLGGGRWQTRDERFTIEPQSGTWVLVDAEQTDDLGLPLVRGPFRSLTDAKAAVEARTRHRRARVAPGGSGQEGSRAVKHAPKRRRAKAGEERRREGSPPAEPPEPSRRRSHAGSPTSARAIAAGRAGSSSSSTRRAFATPRAWSART